VTTPSREYSGSRCTRSWDELIGDLAGRQHGVVSLAQLRALGLTRHRVEARIAARRLRRLHRGVYAVGHDALTWSAHLIAAVFACGAGALASHRAAGAVHGLLRAERIEVTARPGCKPKVGITIHHSRRIQGEDRAVIDAIPVTSVARTLVDLADVLSEERLAKAIHRAETLRVFDLDALERAVVPGRRGRHRLLRVLAEYHPEPHLLRSEAERRLKELCSSHSLPQPQFNVNLHGYEVDAYWPEAALILEFDGAATHRTTRAFHEDRRRDRALAAQGVQSIRVTWPDLGPGLMEELRAILRRR
jgi:very-short-patch-repair endonuclease